MHHNSHLVGSNMGEKKMTGVFKFMWTGVGSQMWNSQDEERPRSVLGLNKNKQGNVVVRRRKEEMVGGRGVHVHWSGAPCFICTLWKMFISIICNLIKKIIMHSYMLMYLVGGCGWIYNVCILCYIYNVELFQSTSCAPRLWLGIEPLLVQVDNHN